VESKLNSLSLNLPLRMKVTLAVLSHIVLCFRHDKSLNAKAEASVQNFAPWRPAHVWQLCYMQVSQSLRWAWSLAVTWRYSSSDNWGDPPVGEYLVQADCPWFPVKI